MKVFLVFSFPFNTKQPTQFAQESSWYSHSLSKIADVSQMTEVSYDLAQRIWKKSSSGEAPRFPSNVDTLSSQE